MPKQESSQEDQATPQGRGQTSSPPLSQNGGVWGGEAPPTNPSLSSSSSISGVEDWQSSALPRWLAAHAQPRHQPLYPNSDLVAFVLRTFPAELRAATRVLDLGCGAGRHVKFLAENGFETYGVDYSEAGLAATAALLERHGFGVRAFEKAAPQEAGLESEQPSAGGGGCRGDAVPPLPDTSSSYSNSKNKEAAAPAAPKPVRLALASISSLPFEEGAFDCVLCFGVLYYNSPAEVGAAAAELARVLRPGGVGYVITRNIFDYRYEKAEKLTRYEAVLREDDPTRSAFAENGMRHYFLDRAEAERLFAGAGFESIQINRIRSSYGDDAFADDDFAIVLRK